MNRVCTSLYLVDEQMNSFIESLPSKQKPVVKDQLMSGKLMILNNLVNWFAKKQQKFILCTKYQSMISIFRKFLKSNGVACFTHQYNTSMDSVYRYNLYQG